MGLRVIKEGNGELCQSYQEWIFLRNTRLEVGVGGDAGKTDACDESDNIVARNQEQLSMCRANPGDQPGCSTRAILERREKICNVLLADFNGRQRPIGVQERPVPLRRVRVLTQRSCLVEP